MPDCEDPDKRNRIKHRDVSPELPVKLRSMKMTLSQELREYLAKSGKDSLLGGQTPLLGGVEIGSQWAVNSTHSLKEKPLFASDIHTQSNVPVTWILYVLEWTDGESTTQKGRVISGAQIPGVPLIGVGRTNDIVWSFTTPNVDTSDLW